MMRSLYSAVSGLKNHQTRMDVIGNNISNINTTGFKAGRVNFATMLSQTLSSASAAQGNRGGTNAQQVGLGSSIASIDTIMTDGSVQSTGNNTDLAISGNGYFVVKDGDQTYYTRDGSFRFDAEGNYVTAGGLKVQGWMADDDGVVNTNADVENIIVPAGQTMAPEATTNIDISKNLSADDSTAGKIKLSAAATSTGTAGSDSTVFTLTDANGNTHTGTITVVDDGTNATITVEYDSLDGFLADTGAASLPARGDTGISLGTGAANTALGTLTPALTWPGAGGTVDDLTEATVISSNMIIYDAEGMEHKVYINYTKSTDNVWNISVNPVAPDAIEAGTASEGILKFNTDGSFYNCSLTSFTLAPSGGATTPQTVNLTFDPATLTQYAGSTTIKNDADGYAAGTLDSVAFDSNGNIIGTFSNGLKQTLAQVAMATFNNPAGLESAGSNLMSESKNSGAAEISTANANGAGTITPSALEMSNANLSEQFTDMIVTQRGYQSNSKIITISDEMLETAINMKR